MKTLDIDECAEFLKINRNTASDLAAAGVLPGAKIGRAWVFLLDDLVEFLRSKVRQQQREREADAALEAGFDKSVLSNSKKEAVTYPAIKSPQRSRRNVPPTLPD